MKHFKRVYLEITNVCNLSCSFCPKTERSSSFLEDEEFNFILKEVKPYTDYLYFHLMGEPLLHPQLKEYLKLAGEMGFQVNLTTNGTLLYKNIDLIAMPALRQVNISLSSYEANDQTAALEEYLDGILKFAVEAQKRGKPIISLRLWNQDNELLGINGQNQRNAEIIHKLVKGLHLSDGFDEKHGNKVGVKLGDGIYLNFGEKFTWPGQGGEAIMEEEKLFCYGLRDHIGILVDGTVVPCCLDSEGSLALGNLFDHPLSMILDSNRANKIHNGFSSRTGVEQLCKTCGYARRFQTGTVNK